MKEFLDFGKVGQLDFLDKKDIHFEHGVHVLDEHLGVILLLEEEGIEAVVDIVLEIVERFDFRTNLSRNGCMVRNDFVVLIGTEICTGHQINELTERESAEVVTVHNSVEDGILLLQTHDSRTCKYNLNLGILIVDKLQFITPIGILEYLVDEEDTTALSQELRYEFTQSVREKVEMVHVDIKAATVVGAEFFQGILKQECGFAYTSRALDSNQAAIPINLVHQLAPYRRINMLNEILMRTIKCLHCFYLLY